MWNFPPPRFSNFAFIEIPFLALRIYGRLVYHLPVTAMMIKNMAELLDLYAGELDVGRSGRAAHESWTQDPCPPRSLFLELRAALSCAPYWGGVHLARSRPANFRKRL